MSRCRWVFLLLTFIYKTEFVAPNKWNHQIFPLFSLLPQADANWFSFLPLRESQTLSGRGHIDYWVPLSLRSFTRRISPTAWNHEWQLWGEELMTISIFEPLHILKAGRTKRASSFAQKSLKNLSVSLAII